MATINKGDNREYRFKIEAYSPETMPLLVLTEYLRDVAEMLGEQQGTHLIRIEKGSTCPVLLIDREAEQKVRKRVEELKSGDAPQNAIEASHRLNRRLGDDSAKAAFYSPAGDNLIEFPGIELAGLSYGPFNQAGTFDGVPIMIGGTKDPVSVHLEGRNNEKYNCTANRSIARQIAGFLFSTIIRVEGTGRWYRHSDGRWEMRSFRIHSFEPLVSPSEISLKKSIEELRAIHAKWKESDDPVSELKAIRQS